MKTRSQQFTVTEVPGSDAPAFLETLMHDRKTGTVTLHLGGGRIGSLEFKEKSLTGREEPLAPAPLPRVQGSVLDKPEPEPTGPRPGNGFFREAEL